MIVRGSRDLALYCEDAVPMLRGWRDEVRHGKMYSLDFTPDLGGEACTTL